MLATGRGQEVGQRTGQAADGQHADQTGQHPQQCVDAHPTGTPVRATMIVAAVRPTMATARADTLPVT